MRDPILPPIEEKRAYVRRTFAAIAPRYDAMNRLMTLGRDRAWRREAVRLCALPDGGRLLDVATGTGDLLCEALVRDPALRAVGLDLTREMMRRARVKAPGTHLRLAQGDALTLPFPDNAFDAACSGFMMRNVVDVAAAFAEQVRVVRTGGRVVCLEITLPRAPVFGRLFHLYFFGLVPALGGLISGRRDAYTYLPHSALDFPRPAQLADIMASAGLRDVGYRLVMLGTIALHWGTK